MKLYDLCGIGSCIVDILLEVSDEEFAKTKFEKASYRILDVHGQQHLLSLFPNHKPFLASGGSVANSLATFSQLGGKAACLSCIGDDKYGIFYEAEFNNLGIEFGNPLLVGENTGTVVVLITPDAERTMSACFAVAADFAPHFVQDQIIKDSKWIFIEGYLFLNPEPCQLAIKKSIELARNNDCKIALTFSDEFVIKSTGPALREALKHADLVFANEAEACAFTGAKDMHSAFEALKSIVPNVIVSGGARGALGHYQGESAHVSAFPCTPKDLTGAGDALAGAFLYGITHNHSLEESLRGGCYIAMQVISRIGARLHSGVKEYWVKALNN